MATVFNVEEARQALLREQARNKVASQQSPLYDGVARSVGRSTSNDTFHISVIRILVCQCLFYRPTVACGGNLILLVENGDKNGDVGWVLSLLNALTPF